MASEDPGEKAGDSGVAAPAAEPESLNGLTRKNIELICELEKLANVKRTRTDRLAAAISQNHEERLARRRNHLDLQINLLSEQEKIEPRDNSIPNAA